MQLLILVVQMFPNSLIQHLHIEGYPEQVVATIHSKQLICHESTQNFIDTLFPGDTVSVYVNPTIPSHNW